jgi:Cu/Ag efflux protein CusF
MRKILLPVVAALSLLAPSLALAAPQTTETTIKALDATAMTITATDGTVYHLASSATFMPQARKFADLKVGSKVKLTWDKLGTLNEASQVQIE